MLYVAAVFTVSFVWLVWSLTHAPAGYENETGFHYGEAKR